MYRVDYKPLSANELWTGRRFPTEKYKKYTKDILFMLPKINVVNGPLFISFVFGFSNKLADLDNPIKGILDILQKKYGFNDNQVQEMNIKKELVQKGQEFIKFEIKEYETKSNT